MPFSFGTDLLLVEDSYADAMLIQIALQRIAPDVNLTCLDSGEAALDYLEEMYAKGSLTNIYMPRMMLVDLKMPGMSGTELLKEISSFPSLRHIPVITYSSFSIPEEEYQLLKAGASAHIIKPFRFDMLKVLLTKMINKWIPVVE